MGMLALIGMWIGGFLFGVGFVPTLNRIKFMLRTTRWERRCAKVMARDIAKLPYKVVRKD